MYEAEKLGSNMLLVCMGRIVMFYIGGYFSKLEFLISKQEWNFAFPRRGNMQMPTVKFRFAAVAQRDLFLCTGGLATTFQGFFSDVSV